MANLYDQANQRQKWDQTIAQVQKMGYPQNPAQPPAFSPPAPRRPTSFGDAAAATRDPGVTQVGVAPTPGVPVGGDRQRTIDAGSAAAKRFGGFPLTAQQQEKVGQAFDTAAAERAAGASAALAGLPYTAISRHEAPQPAPTPTTPNPTDQRLAAGTQTAPSSMAAAALAPAAPEPTIAANPNNVTKTVGPDGRVSYSGGPNISSGITVNGKTPGGGFMVADSLASRALAQAPAQANPAQGFAAPTIQHSGNSWQAANDLRNARVSASSITANGGRFDQTRKGQISPQAATYAAMLGTDQALRQAQPGMAQAAMRENAGLQREGMQQAGANQRAGLGFQTAQQRLAMEQETQGFANRAAQQSEQLRNTLLDPNATPEQWRIAQRSLAALSGKTAADRMQTVTLPDTTNEMGQVVRGGQALVRVLEDGSVQQVPIGRQGGQGQQLPTVNGPDDLAKLPKGAQFIGPDGKTRIKN
jgi:hypothetical protein